MTPAGRRPRRRPWLGAPALLALVPACALALGVQGDPTLVAKAICDCDQLHSVPNCQENLEARLAGADSGRRTSWLEQYATSCSASCDVRMACYYAQPACVVKGNVCSDARECCSYGTAPDLTSCKNNVCR